jgi:hypothetical protein
MISPMSLSCSFLTIYWTLPSLVAHVVTMWNYNSVQRLSKFAVITEPKISAMNSKYFFLTSRGIHELTPPYSPESNGIAAHFNQTIDMIVYSMTIAGLDFPCLWSSTINMATDLKIRLPHNYLPLSTIIFERLHSKRPTISYLNLFRNKCYVHI